MTKLKKKIDQTLKTGSLLDILNPVMNYLISIENNPLSETQSNLIFTLGVPKNWVMTDNVYCEVLRETNELKLIKLEPILESNKDANDFYEYIVNLVNKNLLIDQKRLELDEEINKLKNKFEVEQKELINELYKSEELDNFIPHEKESNT